MPREIIHHGKKFFYRKYPAKNGNEEYWFEENYDIHKPKEEQLTEPDDTMSRYPSFEIAWSKPGDWAPPAYDEDPEAAVQLGLDLDAQEILRAAEDIKKNPDITSRTFYTQSISRYQLNQTIRVIKRARNQALGEDE